MTERMAAGSDGPIPLPEEVPGGPFLHAGDVLVVVSLGRVGASLLTLVDELAARGIGVRATRQQIDTTDPVVGRIVLYVGREPHAPLLPHAITVDDAVKRALA